MPRKREPVTITDLGRYECAQCHVRFAWASTRPIDPPDQRKGMGGRRGGGKPPKYCSSRCAGKAAKATCRQVERFCLRCNARFLTRHLETVFCSRSCKAYTQRGKGAFSELPADHWARWYGKTSPWHGSINARNPAFVAGICIACHQPFLDRWLAESSSRYCTNTCQQRQARQRRKARKRGASRQDAGINWKTLAQRDGLECHICGDLCDPLDKTVANGVHRHGITFPTVDHLLPLSRGGTDTWDNVRLAHLWCNSLKCDTIPLGVNPLTTP